jgi:hypothetical protein
MRTPIIISTLIATVALSGCGFQNSAGDRPVGGRPPSGLGRLHGK